MSLKMLTEMTPSAVVIGLLGWSAFHWGVAGPQLGLRMLKADGHIAACEQTHAQALALSMREEIAAIPPPAASMEQDAATSALRGMMNSPLGQLMTMVGEHSGVRLDDTLALIEERKRQAAQAHEEAVASLKERLTARAGESAGYCGCAAEEAANDIARTDFAIYSGSLTIVRPASIRDLDALMQRSMGSACLHLKEAAR